MRLNVCSSSVVLEAGRIPGEVLAFRTLEPEDVGFNTGYSNRIDELVG